MTSVASPRVSVSEELQRLGLIRRDDIGDPDAVAEAVQRALAVFFRIADEWGLTTAQRQTLDMARMHLAEIFSGGAPDVTEGMDFGDIFDGLFGGRTRGGGLAIRVEEILGRGAPHPSPPDSIPTEVEA